MADIKCYRDLIAWQKAMDLSAAVYESTKQFPQTEMFGLTQQMRRCSVSVASNIAEGWGRGSTGDYVRFLRMARGSLCELETQLCLAERLKMIQEADNQPLLGRTSECSRVLQGLLDSIESRQSMSNGRS